MSYLKFIPNKRVFALAILFAFHVMEIPYFASAQDCDPNEIVNIPGIYKGPGKGSTSGIAKTDLDRQQAVTRKFMSMVVDNYKPRGMNIGYGPAHYPPLPYLPNGLNVGNHYQATFFLMYFYCNYQNKMEQIAETHSTVEIRVNDWDYPSSFFVRQVIDEEDPETDVFATIHNKPVWNENGYWTMTDTIYIVRDITNFHHLITKNKELPFVYVTKKEFLGKLRIYYEKLLRRELSSIENSDDKDTEFGKSSIENYKSFYGNSIRNIDEFLANSAEKVLNEAATVVGGGPPSEFAGFSDSKYRSYVIKPNPKYYDPKAPKHTPHFIDVLFKIYEPEVACTNAKNDILKIIDFKALQEIVDKGGVTVNSGTPVAKPVINTIKK